MIIGSIERNINGTIRNVNVQVAEWIKWHPYFSSKYEFMGQTWPCYEQK